MNVEIRNEDPMRLTDWLCHDSWGEGDALLILLGLDPHGTNIANLSDTFTRVACARKLDGQTITGRDGEAAQQELHRLSAAYKKIMDIWLSGSHPDRNPPMHYIDWAQRKAISIPWLPWAKENGLIRSEPKALSDREQTTYLNIIGALVELLLGTSGTGKRYSPFDSQASIIEVLLTSHPGKPGISQRGLEAKFAAAKRSLNSE